MFTIHVPEPMFKQVSDCADFREAQIEASRISFINLQDLILIKDEDKEVIAIYYRGNMFVKSST